MKRKRLLALVLAVIVSFTGSGTVSAAGLPGTEQTVESTGETSEELTEGDYTYTVSDGCATITSYSGTEEDVVTPAELGGYPVTKIGEKAFSGSNIRKITISEGIERIEYAAFWKCKELEIINISSSLRVLGLSATTDTTALKEINVSSENQIFFSQSGVLFKYLEDGITLYAYPAGKADTEYRVPYFCNSLKAWAFSEVQNLERLYVPNTIQSIADRILCNGKLPVDVYLNHDELPYISAEMFYDMPSGCHVIVKNEEVKADLEEIDIFAAGLSYETPDSSVIVLGTEGYPAIPTTSLTWEGSQTKMSHMLSPGEKCQLTYVQEPMNTTDNITWSSSNEKIARVDAVTGLVEASGCENYSLQTGTCTITGTDESGHSISLDLTVYKPIESVELSGTDETVVLNKDKPYVYAGLEIKPVDANNLDKVEWRSSSGNVAVVSCNGGDYYYPTGNEKDNYYESVGKITLLDLGTTTITATLNDNGTIWTRSFVLTVTKDISDCTVAAIPNQTYTGLALSPAVTVQDENKVLVNGTDYTVTYSDNKEAGMATAVISGKGLYSGTVTTYFMIVKPGNNGSNSGGNTDNTADTGNGADQEENTKPALKSQSITGVSSSYEKAYGSKPFILKAKAKGKVTYTSSNSRVASVNKTTGKVSIKGMGTCTITVTAAATKGYKKAVKKITVNIVPKKAAITYARPLKKSQLTVKWKKDTKATGYQLQYSTSRKFTKKTTKSIMVKKNGITKKTIKKLKAGKKYYVRVKAYKTVKENGKSKNLYGSWSAVKQVK